jgi:nucleoid-associated protein YgaU
MSLEKLRINHEKAAAGAFTGSLTVGFNPAQLVFSSGATWDRNEWARLGALGGTTVFRKLEPETLTVDLFFDTYAPYSPAQHLPAAIGSAIRNTATGVIGGIGRVPPESVTKQTSAVMQLGRVDREMHRPPVCKLVWGTTDLFSGVLTKSDCTFTMFSSDGTPVRATMTCTFTELRERSAAPELHSADVAKTYVVKPGDTLMAIAAAHFGNGAMWRLIAETNGIENPRALVPGRKLSIPKVR